MSPANICSTDVNCGPSVDMWIIMVCFMEPPCDGNWLLEGGTLRPVSLVVMYVGSSRRRWKCLGWRRQQSQNDSTNIQHSRRRQNVLFVLSLFYPLAINTFMLEHFSSSSYYSPPRAQLADAIIALPSDDEGRISFYAFHPQRQLMSLYAND